MTINTYGKDIPNNDLTMENSCYKKCHRRPKYKLYRLTIFTCDKSMLSRNKSILSCAETKVVQENNKQLIRDSKDHT